MAEANRLIATRKLQQRQKERQDSIVIKLIEREQDRRKKRNQKFLPDQKRKRMSEEVNVFAKSTRRMRTIYVQHQEGDKLNRL